MLRVITLAALPAIPVLGTEPTPTTTETWTGWFSDKQCARVRPDEEPRPNGTACVKKCLDEGAPAVFISEQAKAVYEFATTRWPKTMSAFESRLPAKSTRRPRQSR